MNYSSPDPRFRLQVDISVAYGDDIEQVQQMIAAAVRGVDGVLADKPVDVLFLDWGDSGRGLRVQWWIENFHQQYIMTDKVNVVIAGALAQAHIDVPFTTIDLNVKSGEASGLDMQPQPETEQDEAASTDEPADSTENDETAAADQEDTQQSAGGEKTP